MGAFLVLLGETIETGVNLNRNRHILLQLFDRSGVKLHAMLYRLTLDADAAEDLMQELFTRLWKMETIDTIQNLEAYACRVAMNLAFDWRRQRSSVSPLPEMLADCRLGKADLRLTQREDLQQILSAAEQLTGLSRECFVLRYIEQMEYAQIADHTHKTTQQVRGLCVKAIQRIRQLLNIPNASCCKEAVNE